MKFPRNIRAHHLISHVKIKINRERKRKKHKALLHRILLQYVYAEKFGAKSLNKFRSGFRRVDILHLTCHGIEIRNQFFLV